MQKKEEKTLLLDRSYTCPVCGAAFKSKSVKTGVAKLVDTDMDLRPVYQNIDVTKYDVVLCPECGYAALARYFPEVSPAQIQYLKERVAANYKKRPAACDYYDYDAALERYKLALLSTVVKNANPSELGYVCLKISWLYKNRLEALLTESAADEGKRSIFETEAKNFSQKALEHLMQARMEEDYPICGMDETTLDYLLAALAALDGQFDLALRMLSAVAADRNAGDRLKNKAYDLKEYINAQQKKPENQ